MRCLVLGAIALVAACGDNQLGDGVPLAPGHDLVVVAHEDDDLLFMQPDILEAVQHGTGVTSVYVTAGDAGKGTGAANVRYAGLKAAYGHAANDDAWDCGWIEIRGHAAQHCRLAAENVSLVFLGYPDGGVYGELSASLRHLWEGSIASATTVADRTARYDREALIDTVADIVRQIQPAVVHTLDLTAGHGHDHSDHWIVGALATLALARLPAGPEVIAYRGYTTADEPINKIEPLYTVARAVLGRYEACATSCGRCGESCTTILDLHEKYIRRRYAIGLRPTARGELRANGGCLAGSNVTACDTAPSFTLDRGRLVSAGGCLAVGAGGAVAFAPCSDDLAQRFFADDEGHVWSAIVPDAAADLELAHLRCLTPNADGTVTAPVCGGPDTPRWQWAPAFATTPRAALAFAGTGRAVRLGDLTGDGRGDLCAVTASGLACAPGRGDGTFGAAIRIDDPAAPLVIDPQSLALGDLDGDGLLDACGRDSQGILCARAATGFAAARFTPTFSDGDARATTSGSITITDANADGTADVCGLADEGVVCTPGGTSFETQVRSPWPDPAARVLPRELDGDHQADWCALLATGPACGLSSETAVTTDGVPWGYAFQQVTETVSDDPAITDIADIDGDGNGDLCTLPGDGTIGCARSQGHGFGPRTTVAVVPDGAQPSALWLGDLDGDGHADACVDLGDRIACARL